METELVDRDVDKQLAAAAVGIVEGDNHQGTAGSVVLLSSVLVCCSVHLQEGSQLQYVLGMRSHIRHDLVHLSDYDHVLYHDPLGRHGRHENYRRSRTVSTHNPGRRPSGAAVEVEGT